MFAAEDNWVSEADIVFVSSILFSTGMMIALTDRWRRLKRGARVMTLRPISDLLLLHDGFFEMSWGHARVHIYRRQ
ncbi:unnamed protein product [Phaeothamnion confervicola]